MPLSYSDDEGDTWHTADPRPGCPWAELGDHAKLFTGPYTGEALGSYPRAVYYCNVLITPTISPFSGCWRSDDGGATFSYQSRFPSWSLEGQCATDPPITCRKPLAANHALQQRY